MLSGPWSQELAAVWALCRQYVSCPARIWPAYHTGLPWLAYSLFDNVLPFELKRHAAGIGKALAKKLASQGLNVVLVALPDNLLQETHAELSSSYPAVTFRPVTPHKTKLLASSLDLTHHPMQLCGGRWERIWAGMATCPRLLRPRQISMCR